MEAAYYKRQGIAHDVLVVDEIPTPRPGMGEVRVRIYVSGINPTDTKARTGFSAGMAFPRIVPHQDGAGIIDAVGENVSASRIGERVWIYEAQYGRDNGTAAQFCVVPADHAVPLPDSIPLEIGACLGIPALTAHRCLFADGAIHGRRVLVQGGAGVVGSAAIMLAKWAGAWVVATVMRDEDRTFAIAAGADVVINARTENVVDAVHSATRGRLVERIIDVNLLENLDTDLVCLAPAGVIVSYATNDAKDQLPVRLLPAMIGGCVFRFVYIYTVPSEAKRAAVNDITACLEYGSYSPTIARRFPLEHIADAHVLQESGSVVGKILIDIE